VDLEINKDILSPNSRNKYQTKQRQYKLFAVVYHNGTEATKGHYVTDIYHTGLSSWLRCDDSILKTQPESMVLAHSASSVPYILFYRRGDTMVGGPLNDKSGNKNASSSNASKI
jgi:ubiquitin carboxyl-terminal hydrolase 10